MAAEGQNLPSAVQESSQRSDDSLNSERGSEGRSPQPSPQVVSAGAKPGLVRRDMSFSSSNALANLEEAALGLGIQLPGARPRGISDVSLGSGEASNTNLASLMEEPEGTPEVSTRDMKVGAVVMERWQLTRLHAVAEINFLASIGDLPRFKVAVEKLRVDVASERLVDYDMRHPLHVACDSGSFAVTEWLLEQGAPINIIDRFGNTPLSCSVKSRHKLVVQLLDGKGGLVPESRNSTKLVNLYESSLHGNVEVPEDDQDDQWEIPVDSLVMEGLLGEGMFGSVFQAKWRGTPVAVKRLKLDIAANETALNEFKSEIDVQHTLHHPNVGCVRGSSLVWRYHHMVSHHVYCNDDVYDMDVFSTAPIFRLDVNQPKLWYHKFQSLYMWAAYSTLWFSIQYSDWEAFFKRAVPGVNMYGLTYREQAVFLLGKAVHLGLNAALPIYLHGVSAWLPAFLSYPLFGSLLLSWFFMVSHNLVPLKPENFGGLSKTDWAAWQIATSATWGGSWAGFMTGGLNYQIEHHLFPGLAHNLYPQVSDIVKDECAKNNLKYHGYSNLFGITRDLVACMSYLGSAPQAKPLAKAA